MELVSRRTLLFFSALVFSLIVVGCSSSAGTEENHQTEDNGEQEVASDFPQKDIEFVVGYNPGGGYSDYAQGLAPFLQKHLPNDVNVLVRHMPGAGSVTATNYIHSANPDGYTIGIYNVSGLAPTQVSQDVAYDLSDVSWLGRVSTDHNVALVSAEGPYNSIEDFATDKQYIVSTKGLQSQDTIAGAATLDELGIEWQPLNHDGTGETVLAVIRGDADILWSSYESVQQYIESGDLKPIVYYSDEPHPDFPDVPTPSELGLSAEINEGFSAQRLIGGPPGLDEGARAILEEALKSAVEDPDFIAHMAETNKSVFYMDAAGSLDITNNALTGFEKFQHVVDDLYSME